MYIFTIFVEQKLSNRTYTKKPSFKNCLEIIELVEKSMTSFYFKCNYDTVKNILTFLSKVSEDNCPFKSGTTKNTFF